MTASDSTYVRRAAFVVTDGVLLTLAWVLAYLFRFDFSVPSYETTPWGYREQMELLLPWVVGTHLLLFFAFHRYRAILRYIGLRDLLPIVSATVVHALVWFLFGLFLETRATFFELPLLDVSGPDAHVMRVPYPVQAMYFCFGLMLTTGLRLASRLFAESAASSTSAEAPPTLIVGAGDVADAALRDLLRSPHARFRPVCAVSATPNRVGTTLHGIPVRGRLDRIPELLAEHRIEAVLIALDDAGPAALREVVRTCRDAKMQFHILPALRDIADGRVDVRPVRVVKIEDLLGREPVRLRLGDAENYLRNECVLITGAGGSLGSELVRQVLACQPRRILLLGKGENSIHEIRQELASQAADTDLVPLIADIRDQSAMERVFSTYHPAIVFHAAAHKHVDLMEDQPEEAVKNNVLGTAIVAWLAHKHRARRFVMVSSDKAARPAGVMGVTKRLAEQIVFALGPNSETIFQVVRFGNVLGSRGSAIRTFERQIAAGGPITITHPKATRYFLSIAEAVSLVLQAGRHRESGSLFLLDMGEPIAIADLAREMIALSGLREGRDIEIKFSGLRPGEKIEEDLLAPGEHTEKTDHDKIMRVHATRMMNWQEIQQLVDELRTLAEEGEREKLLEKLRGAIPDFHPVQLREAGDKAALEGATHSAEEALRTAQESFRTAAAKATSGDQGDLFAEMERVEGVGGQGAGVRKESKDSDSSKLQNHPAETLSEEKVFASAALASSSSLAPNSSPLTPTLTSPPATPQEPSLGAAAGGRESTAALPLGALAAIEGAEVLAGDATLPSVELPQPQFTHEGSDTPAGRLPSEAPSAAEPSSWKIPIAPELLNELQGAALSDTAAIIPGEDEKMPATTTQFVLFANLDGVSADDRRAFFAHLAERIEPSTMLALAGLSSPADVPPEMRGRTKLVAGGSPADRWNAALESTADDAILCSLAANVRLRKDFFEKVRSRLASDPRAVLAYTDHIVQTGAKSETVLTHDHNGCPHERFEFGPVMAYKAAALRRIKGFNAALKYAWEYDAHLRLMDDSIFVRVAEPVVTVVQPESKEQSKSSALYSPGKGPLGGFSYVFYPADMDAEVTAVFEKALKRWGAWLDNETAPVPKSTKRPQVMATVVIPVLNREKFIGNAVTKVLEGTFQDFEVIVVDNGSTDGTAKVIQNIAAKDARVRLLKGTGTCIASAINDGIRASVGKYICQLDSDDQYAPTTLEKMVAHLEGHPKCGLAISYYRLMDADAKVIEEVAPITHAGYSRNQILRRDGAGALRVWPKAVMEEFGLYDEQNYGNFGEDYDMVLKTGEKYDVDRVHEVLYFYRRHGDNTDVIRDPEMKYHNKNNARQAALKRRKEVNRQLKDSRG